MILRCLVYDKEFRERSWFRYLKLYRAGTLSVDQLDEIRRAGLGSGGRP